MAMAIQSEKKIYREQAVNLKMVDPGDKRSARGTGLIEGFGAAVAGGLKTGLAGGGSRAPLGEEALAGGIAPGSPACLVGRRLCWRTCLCTTGLPGLVLFRRASQLS